MPRVRGYHEARRQERLKHGRFVRQFADDRYRPLQTELLSEWATWNREHFRNKLVEPHLDFFLTPTRSLVTCSPLDGSGGEMLITIKDRIVFGTHPGVLKPWPSEGVKAFVKDLFLHGAVDQYVLEGLDPEEREKHSHAALYAREATRIGISMKLGAVFDRNRPGQERRPLAKFWPHCVRPRGYYQADITEDLEDFARGNVEPVQALTTPSLGFLQLLQYLHSVGRDADAWAMLERHLGWLEQLQPARRHQVPRPAPGLEEGANDTDGRPLGEVSFDPGWLRWNGGTAALIAEGIRKFRTYVELPVLADALEEAGCKEGKLLRHLRERVAHSRRCWALRFVLALDEERCDLCGQGEETEGGES